MTLPIILLIAAAALMMLEIMIPSFGMLGLLAATSYVFAIVLAFKDSMPSGVVTVIAGLVVLPAAIMLGFRLMRKTPFGRRTLLEAPAPESIQRGFAEGMGALVGQRGIALTDLRPTGRAAFGPMRTDVTAATTFVARDTPITVVSVEGTRVLVEPAPDGMQEGNSAP